MNYIDDDFPEPCMAVPTGVVPRLEARKFDPIYTGLPRIAPEMLDAPGAPVPKWWSLYKDPAAHAAYAQREKPMHLPADPAARKATPITTGVLDYFPLAVAEVARVSKAGNDQHNPGQPLHWDRAKSIDHADCIARHLVDRGSRDTDGMRHSAKLVWRALALLQTELESAA